MYKFFQCQKQMFLDSELEIYYDLLKNDQILLQCVQYKSIIFILSADLKSWTVVYEASVNKLQWLWHFFTALAYIFWISWREGTAKWQHIFGHSAMGCQKDNFYDGWAMSLVGESL
jgi:hypothetical protein